MNDVVINKELDVKGLNCPLPILRAKKALTDMESGQVLRVVATDPGSVKDFAAFCKQTGNPLLASEESSSAFTFLISKR
jgi:tRNA 2-thiouridine synthesizing protein A